MKNKKGISPVIATVLLIAIVIVLAGIVALWAGNVLKEQDTKFGEPIKDVCKRVNLVTTESNGIIDINNRGDFGIFDVKIKISDSGDTDSIDCGDNSIAPGRSIVIDVNADCGSYNGEDLVAVVPVLKAEQGDTTVNHECSNVDFTFR